jgi:hypothetical protein
MFFTLFRVLFSCIILLLLLFFFFNYQHQLDHSHRQPQLATIHSNTTTGNHILTHCKTHRQPLGLRSAKPSTTTKLIANPRTTTKLHHRETTSRSARRRRSPETHTHRKPTKIHCKPTKNPEKTHCKLNKNPSLWLLLPQPITASPHPSPSSAI